MWASPQAWVFSKKRIIQRLLPLGQCSYLHAAIVCQYYASLLIPVDLRQFALNYLEPQALLGAITHTGSGWSKRVFLTLLGHYNLAATSHFDEMQDMLVKYGPGLVSEMRIVPEMYEGVRTVFSGPQPTQFVGKHSMVVLGIRENQDGKFVLLQTCWKNKEWIECDQTYFQDSRAVVYFSKKPAEILFAGNDAEVDECDIGCDDSAPPDF
jgi:hypothetical protein